MLSKQQQRELLGKKVETLRKAKGMTQAELAKKAGFAGRASINSIEKAHSGINVARLPDLARALGVDPLVLFDDDKQPDFTLEDKLVEKIKRLEGKDRMLHHYNAINQGVSGFCYQSISGRLAVRRNTLNFLISIAKQIGKTKGLQGYIRLKSGRKSRRGMQARVFIINNKGAPSKLERLYGVSMNKSKDLFFIVRYAKAYDVL